MGSSVKACAKHRINIQLQQISYRIYLAFEGSKERDQIVFSDVAPKEEHLHRCVLADLALDTIVYNSHSSAVDVLWAGTPMITMPGEKMCQRASAGLLKGCGLEVDRRYSLIHSTVRSIMRIISPSYIVY
jgi:hypothetical protein